MNTQDYIKNTLDQAVQRRIVAHAALHEIDSMMARAERIHMDQRAALEVLEKKGSAAEDKQVRRLVQQIAAGKTPTHIRNASDEVLVSDLLMAKQQVSVAAKALASLTNSRASIAAEAEAADKVFNNLIRAEHAAVQQRLVIRLNEIAGEYNETCQMIHSLAGIGSGVPGQPEFSLSIGIGMQLQDRIVGGTAGNIGYVQGFPVKGPHRIAWEQYFANYSAGKPGEMPKTRRELEAVKLDLMIKEAINKTDLKVQAARSPQIVREATAS